MRGTHEVWEEVDIVGYTTEFRGEFKLNKPLTPEHKAYLLKFSRTRRMKRDAEKTARRKDPVREAVGLPVGAEGAYFVGADGFRGQEGLLEEEDWQEPPDIVSFNEPPAGQSGLWCHWIPNDDGIAIVWDRRERFHNYVEWLEYLIEHFLEPWGYVLNGEVEWRGEGSDDTGMIVVAENDVEILDVVGVPLSLCWPE